MSKTFSQRRAEQAISNAKSKKRQRVRDELARLVKRDRATFHLYSSFSRFMKEFTEVDEQELEEFLTEKRQEYRDNHEQRKKEQQGKYE